MTAAERATRYIADTSCTRSKRVAAYPSGVGGYAVRGEGPYLILEDGRRMLDWLGSLGATPLGYSHPRIVEAVTRQVQDGAVFSCPSVLEGRVAERLAEVIPCAEQFKFFKTGSESTSAAVAIARAATGRDLIIADPRSYHGWHDGFRAMANSHPGTPDVMGELIRYWPESDDLTTGWHGLDLAGAWEDVAAVIIEPPRYRKVDRDWFQKIHETAHAHGALVIHDNMIWGGRHALAGADEYFGVVSDLSCFGKAFGAGLPLAFVCGRQELMQHAWVASGTFSGDTLALAACEAMLGVYRDEDVIARLWSNGQAIVAAIELAADRYGVDVQLPGYAPHFTLRFAEDHQRKMSVFCQRMAEWGILWHPAVTNSSAVMTVYDLAMTHNAVIESIEDVANNYPLVGDVYAEGARVTA
jgi:glutamate-1-semialdehyde aminotransferase